MKVLEHILNRNVKYNVGLSGGLDSISLLHWMNQNGYSVSAVHVDHAISENSLDWVGFCREYCKKLGIDFYSERVDLTTVNSNNLEDAARIARYGVFSKFENIVLAHHVLDQEETFFLKLLRGAGPDGLKCMESVSTRGKLTVYRPFLDTTKQEIEQYAINNTLNWVEDPSNNDSRFDRNYLRHKLLPGLHLRFPNFLKSLRHVIDAQKEAAELVTELAKMDLENVSGKSGHTFYIYKLKELSSSRIKNLLKYLVKEKGNHSVSRGQLEEFVKVVKSVNNGSNAVLVVGGLTFRQHRNTFEL